MLPISAPSTTDKSGLQLDLFEATPPSSPLIGQHVRLSRTCRCGSNVATIGSSAGPHAARLRCSECGIHRGWMGSREVAFVTKIVSTFGCPATPIVIRALDILAKEQQP
jgi:hypothetical protein